MDARERAYLALTGGVFCAVVGSILGGLIVILMWVIRSWPHTEDMWNAVADFPMVLIFSAIAAAPFGFIVGTIGSWWLAARWVNTRSSFRIYAESGGLGAILGATYPFIAAGFGDGPFDNLVASLPISIGAGILSGVLLAAFVRKYLLGPHNELI